MQRKKTKLYIFVISAAVLFGFILCLSILHIRPVVVDTVDSSFATYYKMSDGTWKYGDNTYKYRLAIHGETPYGPSDTIYIYLSNTEDISPERAWKASGVSSFSEDYFSPEEAVFVGWAADS